MLMVDVDVNVDFDNSDSKREQQPTSINRKNVVHAVFTARYLQTVSCETYEHK